MDGTEQASRVPETEWGLVDLTEPPRGQRTWILFSIERGATVTDPVPIATGGPDANGGAPVIAIGDDGMPVLRGCNVVPLHAETRGVDPWLGLAAGQGSIEGCAGVAGEQHGQILKVLSLGVTPRVHDTADGMVLVLTNDEGTLVFRDASAGT